MIRAAYTLAIFLVLCAWAGAQGPQRAVLTAADQLRLHRANKTLLTDLVNNGIKLGTTDGTVDRVVACQATARSLGAALGHAANANESDRVVELASHLELLVRDGLVPMLDDAKIHITKQSPEYERLMSAQKGATDNLKEAREALDKLDNANARDVSTRLGGLKEKLK